VSTAFDHLVTSSQLEALKELVRRYGVEVEDNWDEPEGGRFIGTIDGNRITLFPKYDHPFALFFTVAHLFGHLAQLARGGEHFRSTVDLLYRVGEPLRFEEVQAVFEFELEAARIGRRLLDELGPVSADLDRQYSRYFFADFHYLVHFLETNEQGPALFERFLRRQPVTAELVAPDPRPLPSCGHLATSTAADVIVV
jgi:hypothetical protein